MGVWGLGLRAGLRGVLEGRCSLSSWSGKVAATGRSGFGGRAGGVCMRLPMGKQLVVWVWTLGGRSLGREEGGWASLLGQRLDGAEEREHNPSCEGASQGTVAWGKREGAGICKAWLKRWWKWLCPLGQGVISTAFGFVACCML